MQSHLFHQRRGSGRHGLLEEQSRNGHQIDNRGTGEGATESYGHDSENGGWLQVITTQAKRTEDDPLHRSADRTGQLT